MQTWHVLEISSTLVVTYIGPRWLNSNLYRTRETNSSQKFNYANLIPWLLKICLRDTGSISVQQNMPCDIVIWGGSQNNKAHKNRQISMQLANSNRPTYPFNSTRRGRVAFLGNTKFHVSLLLLLWDSLNCYCLESWLLLFLFVVGKLPLNDFFFLGNMQSHCWKISTLAAFSLSLVAHQIW